MGEIQEIMWQFDHGNGEWKQLIKSNKINNIYGWPTYIGDHVKKSKDAIIDINRRRA